MEAHDERMRSLSLHWPGVAALFAILAAIVLLEIFAEPGTTVRLVELVLAGVAAGGAMIPMAVRHEKPRPRRRPPSDGALALGLVIFAAALSAATSGCGAGAIRTHYQAVTILASTHAVAGAGIDDARSAALDRIEAELPRGPERVAALELEAARWRPLGVMLDTMREALLTWDAAIDAARLAGTEDGELLALLAPLVARVVLLYDQIAAAARELGATLPALPSAARALASAIGGAS